MKKIVILIAFLFVSSYVLADGRAKITETPEGYVYDIQSDPASLDSGDVFTGNSFDALPILFWYMQGNLSAYTARDTTVDNYKHSNVPYAEVTYDGSGTDSTGVVLLQGQNNAGTWVTFDTLATAGATAIASPIYLYTGIPYYTNWRVKTTVADITVSSYDATLRVRIIVPKLKG